MNETNNTFVLPFNDVGMIVTGIILLVFLIIGVVLNVLTIAVIRRIRDNKYGSDIDMNVFSCFLMSLCISDLLSALISPLFWYRRTLGFNVWEISDFLCKMYWGSDMMTSCVTALHILAFTVLRYIAITRPNIFNKVTPKRANMIICAIWATGFFAVFIPFAYFNKAVMRNRNSNDEDAQWTSCSDTVDVHKVYGNYVKIAFGILLYLPMFLIVILSILIVFKVKKRFGGSKGISSNMSLKQRKGRNRKERQAVLQLVLIVVSFLIGYFPSAIYAVWTQTHERYTPKYAALDYWGLIICYLMIRFSECLDPVFYNLGSSQMRRETMKMLSDKISYCRDYLYKHGEDTFSSNSLSTKATGSTKVQHDGVLTISNSHV